MRGLFDCWISEGVSRQDSNAELRRSFEKDVLPALGAIAVRKLDDRALRDALRAVGRGRGRGRGRTAERLLAEVSQMFLWAEKRKPWRALLVEGNPAELIALRTVVPPSHAPAIRDRVLSPDELVELRDRFQQDHTAYITASDRRATHLTPCG